MTRFNPRRRPTTLPLGTLAEATCKPDDWIDGLRYPLERMHLRRADRATVRRLLREYDTLQDQGIIDGDSVEAAEACDDILQELIAVAENYLMPYTYLGTLEGDGACFGVWADVESVERAVQDGEIWYPFDATDADGFTVEQYTLIGGKDHRATERGITVWAVNDHGNGTLRHNGREVWSVV